MFHAMLAAVVFVLLALNAIAYWHARALLRFEAAGTKTKDPEQLSTLEKLGVLVMGAHVPKPTDARTPSAHGLAYESHMITVGARVKLGAWWIPSAAQAEPGAGAGAPPRTVIFFHGFIDSKAQLLDEALAFHTRGFAALMVDFRGSGDSSERYTTVGHDEADDVLAAVRYTSKRLGVPAPVLYGCSMGAAAVLRAFTLGLRSDEVSGVVLEGVFDRMLGTVKARFHIMHLPASPFAELLVLWGGVQSGFWGFGHNPVDYAPSCHVRALMLHGGADQSATLPQAEHVYEALAGDKTLCVFPGAQHEPLLAYDAKRWNDAIDKWLAAMR